MGKYSINLIDNKKRKSDIWKTILIVLLVILIILIILDSFSPNTFKELVKKNKGKIDYSLADSTRKDSIIVLEDEEKRTEIQEKETTSTSESDNENNKENDDIDILFLNEYEGYTISKIKLDIDNNSKVTLKKENKLTEYEIGDKIDNAEIIRIRRTNIILEKNDKKIQLNYIQNN